MPRSSKFDRVIVAEATINVLEQPGTLVAKAAFVNTETGATHGQTTCRQWSPATTVKLKELLDAMSADLEAMHFADGGQSFATTAGGSISNAAQGLGESLGAKDDGIPQG